MKILIKAICPEILGDFPSHNYDMPDGLSAIDVMKLSVEMSETDTVDINCLDKLVYMRNGKHITKDTVLTDGDTLMALRPVYGG